MWRSRRWGLRLGLLRQRWGRANFGRQCARWFSGWWRLAVRSRGRFCGLLSCRRCGRGFSTTQRRSAQSPCGRCPVSSFLGSRQWFGGRHLGRLGRRGLWFFLGRLRSLAEHELVARVALFHGYNPFPVMRYELESFPAFDNQCLKLEYLLLANRDLLVTERFFFREIIEKLFQHLQVNTGHDS